MADTNEKILKALEALQADVSTLKADIRTVDRKVEAVDLKVETVHEFNKKAHTQIMDVLVESGEPNYQELKKELKKRIEQLETRQQN